MSRILQNHWLSIAVRIFLGSVFVYSAWPKIADPPGFAHAVWNYAILPSQLISAVALILPWLELLSGVALIAGIFRRGAALVVAMMLAVFIAALSLNVLRDIPIDCGCFSIAAANKSHDELIAGMKMDILRDVGLLLMAFHALLTPAMRSKPVAD